ncbi:MAG: type II toxin-antitoxin system RelE/ParE family toxin [Parafilimonas terrae]|nr:type II toxin-antitoxin system RelE/ParE family toxin [Parafilimonas terrae]
MKLRLTRPASRQLESVLRHIATHHPQGAKNVNDRLRSVMHVLVEHPYAGRVTARPPIRRIVALPYPYAITYTVAEDKIIVLGIRHTSPRPQE